VITVSILINGKPIFTRSAVNKTRELLKKYPDGIAEGFNFYKTDCGAEIYHKPTDGAISLAIEMLKKIKEP